MLLIAMKLLFRALGLCAFSVSCSGQFVGRELSKSDLMKLKTPNQKSEPSQVASRKLMDMGDGAMDMGDGGASQMNHDDITDA